MHTRTHSRRQAKPCTACGQRASQTTCLLFRGAARRAAPCAPRSSPHQSTCPMRGTATSGAPPPMLQARKRARFTTTISLPWPLETDRRAVEGLRGVLDFRTTLQTSTLLVVRPPLPSPPLFSGLQRLSGKCTCQTRTGRRSTVSPMHCFAYQTSPVRGIPVHLWW